MSMENSIRVVQEWYNETSKTALQDALREERYYGERDGERDGIKQKAIETAQEMLKRNMAVELISDITKLPKSEILSLRG